MDRTGLYRKMIAMVGQTPTDFIRSIKPKTKTGTISDAWLDARQNVNKYVNSEMFDVIVFSAEEGVKKPEPEIYQKALTCLNVESRETVFIDDRLPNVLGAWRLGMHAVQHTETSRTIHEILQLLKNQH